MSVKAETLTLNGRDLLYMSAFSKISDGVCLNEDRTHHSI